jgi:hypothetical protein
MHAYSYLLKKLTHYHYGTYFVYLALKTFASQAQWLMSTVPHTWEAVISMTAIQVQPSQKVRLGSISKLGVEACACHFSYKEGKIRKIAVQASLGNNMRLYWKNN